MNLLLVNLQFQYTHLKEARENINLMIFCVCELLLSPTMGKVFFFISIYFCENMSFVLSMFSFFLFPACWQINVTSLSWQKIIKKKKCVPSAKGFFNNLSARGNISNGLVVLYQSDKFEKLKHISFNWPPGIWETFNLLWY